MTLKIKNGFIAIDDDEEITEETLEELSNGREEGEEDE